MCKIFSTKIRESGISKTSGTGFFLYINNENVPFNECLMTNNHILDENDLKINNKIYIEYQNKEKIIEINKKRRTFTDKELDYSAIEILKEDNIKLYFEIEKNINNINPLYYKNHDIFVLQYPNGGKLSFSYGKIKSINDEKITHTAATKEGSSGSPIISRPFNLSIIGLHYGTFNNQYNLATRINVIINDIIKKNKIIPSKEMNLILDNEELEKKLLI